MLQFDVVTGVARAELRLVRRLVRYWIFTGLASLLALASYFYYAFLHYKFSAWSASVASITPRFLVALLGLYYVLVMMFGLVFLGFDLRARDVRERVSEALDSRPCSNLELLAGKFLGLLVASWIPVAVVSLTLLLVGQAIGEPVEPYSLAGYLFVLVPPALVFTLGLVFLVTLLVRHRAVAAVLLILLVLGLYFALFWTPIWRIGLFDVLGAYVAPFPSDLMPRVADWATVTQRAGVLLAGLGLLAFAAAVHPRRDDGSRRASSVAGAALCAAGVGLCSVQAFTLHGALARRAEWRLAHAERRDDPAPDVRRVSGTARIEPGREIALDLSVEIEAPAGAALASALFTLNPGLALRQATDEAGAGLRFEQGRGLLEVFFPEPLPAGQRRTIGLSARGRPDPWFAYLDAVRDPLEVSPKDGQMFLLGFDPLVFDRRVVALLPGVRWLPQAGAEIGRSHPAARPDDFFEIDLVVDVPAGFLVAGPGRRRDEPAPAGRARFRFAPGAPLPGAAVVVGRFERRAAEIQGVVVEALVHRAHGAAFGVFEDAGQELHDWLDERLREAKEVGLGYPYDGLTLVEVPGTLRGYGGGWRMDTTLGQPGLVLVREAGFPTARFDAMFDDPRPFADREGGIARAKRDALVRFFENDFNGGNPFIGAGRSFFGFVTAARGADALPLDFVLEDLSNRLVTGRRGYFSLHVFNQDALNQTIGAVLGPVLTGQGDVSVVDAMIGAVTSRIEVWDTVLGVSLANLDPWDDPRRTVDVLTLKGGAMAQSLLDGLGRARAGRFAGALRGLGYGGSFTRDDVVAAGQQVGEDLDPWLAAWVEDTRLPGFVCDDVALRRLPDADDGSPRYQLVVRVRNGETSPGLVRLDVRTGEGERAETVAGDPVLVPGHGAVEIGMVTSSAPRRASLIPYLSLNRGPIVLALPQLDAERIVQAEPFTGTRDAPFDRGPEPSIVVDDLDPGFRVEQPEQRGALRFSARDTKAATDQGLPVSQFGRRPSEWTRRSMDDAWGRYRRTVATVRAGSGKRRAVFETELPRAARWRLECHVPGQGSGERFGERLGGWKLAVVDATGRRTEIAFDARGGQVGWNTLDTLELPAGSVRVELSDETDGRLVYADAVRWTPV